MDYLSAVPMAYKHKDFIRKFRTLNISATNDVAGQLKRIFVSKIPQVQIDPETGRKFAVFTGKSKMTFINVRVTDSGSGNYTYNGNHYSEFRMDYQR